jgi:hypothetical protein
MAKLNESQIVALRPWAWLYLATFVCGIASFGFLFWYQWHTSNRETYIFSIWGATTLFIQALVQTACFYKLHQIRGEQLSFSKCLSLIFRIGFFFVMLCFAVKFSIPG